MTTQSALVKSLLLASIIPAFAAESPEYLKLESAEVAWKGNANAKTVKPGIKTRHTVPMNGKSDAFGYAL